MVISVQQGALKGVKDAVCSWRTDEDVTWFLCPAPAKKPIQLCFVLCHKVRLWDWTGCVENFARGVTRCASIDVSNIVPAKTWTSHQLSTRVVLQLSPVWHMTCSKAAFSSQVLISIPFVINFVALWLKRIFPAFQVVLVALHLWAGWLHWWLIQQQSAWGGSSFYWQAGKERCAMLNVTLYLRKLALVSSGSRTAYFLLFGEFQLFPALKLLCMLFGCSFRNVAQHRF